MLSRSISEGSFCEAHVAVNEEHKPTAWGRSMSILNTRQAIYHMAQTLIRTIRSPAGFPCLRRRTGESLPNSNSFLFASWRPFSGIPAPLRRIMLLDSNFLSKHFHPDMESRLFYSTPQKRPPTENPSKPSPVHGRAQGRLPHAFYALNRPIRLITRQKSLSEAKIYSFPVGIFFGRRGSASGSVLGRSMPELSLPKRSEEHTSELQSLRH